MSERLVVLRQCGRLPPLFCVHPVGGHVNEYERLAALLEDERPVFAIRSRACVEPEREHPNITEMAAEYAGIVRGAVGARPVVMFGWSFGAVVAHATACELEHGALLVGMADPRPGAPPENDDRRAAVAMALRIFQDQRVPGPRLRRELQALPDDADPSALVAWCERRGLLPNGRVSPALFGGALGLFSVHRRLIEAYSPRTCGAPIVLWRADPRYHREGYDWSKHTTGAFRQKNVGGTHFAMMSPPHIDAIASDLREVAIETADEGRSP